MSGLLKNWNEYSAGTAKRHVDVETVVGALTTTTAVTYAASIAVDPSTQAFCPIVATDSAAFTIANPLNARAGMTLTFDILNSSGGTLGTITWDTLFKLAGAFTKPASTKRRTISFYFDGTSWVETGRAAADI